MGGNTMRMTINIKNIQKYAAKYDEQYRGKDDEKTEKEMKNLLRNQRYLKKEEFKKIVGWKTRNRSVHYCEENKSDKVIRITKHSFSVVNEKDRIEYLLGQKGGLRGVGYPVASTILHFAFPKKYPIIDFRVLRSLWDMKKEDIRYDFRLWERYFNKVRAIAKKYRRPVRKVEKALWKYDEIKFGRRKTCNKKG